MTVPSRINDALAARYSVEREAGAGGMATVYLARDLRHDRRVALKVLHPDLAAALGAERFLAEIRTTANLQHPHILPLHDSGEADGFLYYVMPFVEGETLRSRLERERQLPLDDALRIVREVLSALDYAHRHGVVHRDVKPENVLLHDGAALVADFGIALAVTAAGGQRMTQTGLSLGTPQYMAPEQAMGERQIDGRADVYAAGAMLYEMLTGEPPFSGATVQAIVAKIITERPAPPSTVRDTVPPLVEAAVLRALAKLPADRFATAAQFADALGQGARDGAAMGVPSRASSAGRSARTVGRARVAMPWVVAGVATAAAAVLAVVASRGRPAASSPAPIRFSLELPPGVRPILGGQTVTVSRDGRRLAFLGGSGGVQRVYVRDLGDFSARALDRTEGAQQPSLSPDGRWVVYHDGGRLLRVPFEGGPTSVVADSVASASIGWLSDSEFVSTRAGVRVGLSRWALSGGPPTTVTRSDSARGVNHGRPLVLDDHETLLFINRGPGGNGDDYLAIGSLRTGEFTVTAVNAVAPLGVVDGRVLYVRLDGAVMAARIDPRARRITGDPVPLLDGSTIGALALSASGTLVQVRDDLAQRVVRIDSRGTATDVLRAPATRYMNPRVSPDGRRLAIASASLDLSSFAVSVVELPTGTPTRLTSEESMQPEWSPDGRHVFFLRLVRRVGLVGSALELASRAADLRDDAHSVPLPAVIDRKNELRGFLMAPDGRSGALLEASNSVRSTLYLVDTVARTMRRLTPEGEEESKPRLSPDGRWLAFASPRNGRENVFVRPFSGPGPRVQISQDGGTEPVWSRDGRRLYYRASGRIMAASLSTETSLAVTGRADVREDQYLSYGRMSNYDVAPDGSLYFVRSAGGGEVVTVTVNWLDEVRAKLAAMR
jgi:serine/threonine-protein kinase